MSHLLEVKNLHVHYKVYGGTLKVLDGVNLHVDLGEKVGVVGETGCGKTTTMKAILRILPIPPAKITSGEVFFNNEDILKKSKKEMERVRGGGISMIFQDPTAALNPVFNISQQLLPVIRYNTQNNHKLRKGQIYRNAVTALQDVSLADPDRLLKSYPLQLSGGMRQRVCIGMALATKPQLLIADEPGTSLDVTIQAQVLKLLHDLVIQKQTSIILITHSLGIVREMTDRVYVMYAGNIVEEAPTEILFSNPCHPYTNGLFEAVPKLTGGGIASGIAGHIPSYLEPPTGCRFHPRCRFAMTKCKHEKPPLMILGHQHGVSCFLYEGKDRS